MDRTEVKPKAEVIEILDEEKKEEPLQVIEIMESDDEDVDMVADRIEKNVCSQNEVNGGGASKQ